MKIETKFRLGVVCLLVLIFAVSQHFALPEESQKKLLYHIWALPKWIFWGLLLLVSLQLTAFAKLLWWDIPKEDDKGESDEEEGSGDRIEK